MSTRTVVGMAFTAVIASFAVTASGALSTLTPKVLKASWADAWWVPRHQAKVAEAAKNAPKVVFIGDSITHHWDTCATAQRDKYFSKGDLRMLNLGFEGDRTQNVLWRLTEGKELDGYEAKVIFLMIGTNNAGWGQEPPIDTIAGVREIIRVIREKQPKAKLVLTAIFPRGKAANDRCRIYNDTVNREIAKFADGKDVVWLDFNDRFLEPDGTLPQKMFPDFLHPVGAGYEIWAEEALPYAKAALAGKPMPKPKKGAASVRADAPRAAQAVSRIGSGGSGMKDSWLERALAVRNQIVDSRGEFDVVLLGDSAFDAWEKDGKDSYDELKASYSVLNLGCSGDCTENVIWRGLNGQLEKYKATCVVLMAGSGNLVTHKDKPEDVAAGVRRILEIIAEKQPKAKTLLLPVLPTDGLAGAAAEKANALIKGCADNKKVFWVKCKAPSAARKQLTAADYRETLLSAIQPHLEVILGK